MFLVQGEAAAKVDVETIQAKPILKWAGGKGQMLGEIIPRIPAKYGKYIEPFCGGAALFFALAPENAILADSNPELINVYEQVAHNVEEVIRFLQQYRTCQELLMLGFGQWALHQLLMNGR